MTMPGSVPSFVFSLLAVRQVEDLLISAIRVRRMDGQKAVFLILNLVL